MAIAFDNATFASEVSTTTRTFSHTVNSNTNGILIVLAHNNSGATDTFTGVTYAGVAMTRLTGVASANGDMYDSLWCLLAPASGTNNVVITSSTTRGIIGMASGYTGVSQAANPTVYAASSSATSSTSVSSSVTPTVDNSWIVVTGAQNAVGITASTNINNVRASEGGVAYRRIADSGVITPAASTSQTWTYASNCCIITQVVIAPVSTPTGPTNVKTVNGLTLH